jgi:hypothetical protein
MLPATSEAEKVRFHTLNRATGNRVHARYVDAETGKPVDDEDQVKGYEREDGEYVMLEDEELDAVAVESTRTIDIDCFVPADSIGWIWYDKPHYLVPDADQDRGRVGDLFPGPPRAGGAGEDYGRGNRRPAFQRSLRVSPLRERAGYRWSGGRTAGRIQVCSWRTVDRAPASRDGARYRSRARATRFHGMVQSRDPARSDLPTEAVAESQISMR